jgi:WD40 repeat protein
MPDGLEYLALGLVLFGFALFLPVQIVFSVLLLRRIWHQSMRQGRILAVIAIVMAVIFVFVSLFGLVVGEKIASVWSRAGWLFLCCFSVCNIFWAAVVLIRPVLSVSGKRWVQWLPMLLSISLSILSMLPYLIFSMHVQVADRQAHRFVKNTLHGHFLEVDDIAFSDDGEMLWSVSAKDKNPWPSGWELSSSKRLKTSNLARDVMVAPGLCFVKNGFLSTEMQLNYSNKRLLLRPLAQLDAPAKHLEISDPRNLACTPDGAIAVVGSGLSSGEVTVFRFPETQIAAQWKLSRYARHLAISRDGQFIAYNLDRLNSVYIRRLSDGKLVRRINIGFTSYQIGSLALSADGEYIAIGGQSGSFEVWSRLQTEAKTPLLKQSGSGWGGPTQVLFLQDSPQLIATNEKNFVLSRWSVGNWQLIQKWDTWPDGSANRCILPRAFVSVQHDGRELLLVGCDKHIDVLDLSTNKIVRTFAGLTGGLDALAFAQGYLAVGGHKQPLAILSWETGQHILKQTPTSLVGSANAMAIDRPRKLLATGMQDGIIALFEMQTNQFRLRSVLSPPLGRIPGNIESLAFSEDGRYLLSADTNAIIRLWSVEQNSHIYTLITDPKADTPIALISMQGNRFMTAHTQGKLRRWIVDDRRIKQEQTFDSGCKKARSLAMSDNHIAVGCDDGSIRLLSQQTSTVQIATQIAHPSGVSAIAIDPSEKFLISGGADGRLLVWSLPQLDQRCQLFSPQLLLGQIPVLKAISRIVFAAKSDIFAIATQRNHNNIHIFSLNSMCRMSK